MELKRYVRAFARRWPSICLLGSLWLWAPTELVGQISQLLISLIVLLAVVVWSCSLALITWLADLATVADGIVTTQLEDGRWLDERPAQTEVSNRLAWRCGTALVATLAMMLAMGGGWLGLSATSLLGRCLVTFGMAAAVVYAITFIAYDWRCRQLMRGLIEF